MAGHLKQYRPCSNFPHFILHTYINTQTHTHTLSPLQTRIYICIHITHMYINKCNNTHGSHTNTLTHTHTILHCINKGNHTADNPSKAIYTKRHTLTLNRNVQSLRRHQTEIICSTRRSSIHVVNVLWCNYQPLTPVHGYAIVSLHLANKSKKYLLTMLRSMERLYQTRKMR